jgi:hypothetical protein
MNTSRLRFGLFFYQLSFIIREKLVQKLVITTFVDYST